MRKPQLKRSRPKKTNPARRRKETSSLPWKRMMKAERLRRKREKEAREYARKYGSKERVIFVQGLPCAACGVVGYSENAHVSPKGEAGTGYKAAYRFIAPLCGTAAYHGNWGVVGCHQHLHAIGRQSFEARYDVNLAEIADQTENLWRASLGSAPGGQT